MLVLDLPGACEVVEMVFDIEGVLAPVFTPFYRDGTLNLEVIPGYLQFLTDHGVQGILVGGTSGESICLSLQERKEVLSAWIAAAKPAGVKIIAQVGGVPLPEVLEMAQYANAIGVNAVMTLPEIYYKPRTTEDVVSYLETVSNAAGDLPLVYYHFPMMSGVELKTPEFFEMASARVPTFKAMKADIDVAVQVSSLMKSDQRIFIGNHMIAPAVLLGHNSSIATVTNLFPTLMHDIVRSTQSGDVINARKHQESMNNLVFAITSAGDFLPTMKVAMELVTGIKVGPARKPLSQVNNHQRGRIAKKLESLGISLNVE